MGLISERMCSFFPVFEKLVFWTNRFLLNMTTLRVYFGSDQTKFIQFLALSVAIQIQK